MNGQRCRLVDIGTGPPVVALHGLGSLARELAAPLLPLSECYRLIAPDRPGYGGSEPLDEDPLSPQAQAAWLHELLRQENIVRPVIVAQSIASAIALAYAVRHPDEVAGLVLITPFCRPTRPGFVPSLRVATLPVVGPIISGLLYPWLADLVGPGRLRRAVAPFPLPDYLRHLPFRELVTAQALRTMAAELYGFNRGMIAERTSLRHLRVPVAVLAGAADQVADPERHARWLAKRVPRSRFRKIQAAGHLLHHVAPQAVTDAVNQFHNSVK
ncbi:MAG: alpha/beta hydrolase [Proteobacteria bacterium]|nr:alpha/beta hydrolase [Pseudomonadota bacterium]